MLFGHSNNLLTPRALLLILTSFSFILLHSTKSFPSLCMFLLQSQPAPLLHPHTLFSLFFLFMSLLLFSLWSWIRSVLWLPWQQQSETPSPSSSRHHALISPPINFEHVYHMSPVSAGLYLQKEPSSQQSLLQFSSSSSSPSTSSLGRVG